MNDMKQTLLTCIEIAKNKGVFFEDIDFERLEEYIENMLDENELERAIEDTNSISDDEKFLLKHIDKNTKFYESLLKSIEVDSKIKEKLEEQKRLLENYES